MNPLAPFKCAQRVLMALAAIAGIFLTAGCGTSGGPIIVKGGFSKASLNGSYAFTVKGYGLNVGSSTAANFFVEGGVFTADGNGNITAGTDDFVEAVGSTTQAFPGSAVTGVYSIAKDGTGDLQFNFSGGGAEVFRITLSDTSHLYMEEEDGFGTSAGSAELQDSALLSTIPTGTFVFRTHDVFVSATMGTMAISAGAVSGSFLMVQNGAPVTGSIGAGGSMTAPAGGRGTITYSVNGLTHSAQYYVVSSSKFLLLDTTTNILSIGLAEQQSATAFSAASLSGSYAFGSSGETATTFVNTVGVFTTDGASQVTAANFDSVQDGAVASNQTATGTYLIDNSVGNGSGSFTIGGLVRDIWMVSPTRAYFIALNGTNVEDGTLDQQTGAFTNTSLGTQAAFFMDGFDATGVDALFKDRAGTLVPSGTTSLATNYVASFFDINAVAGGASLNSFSGSYSVASNGRTTTVLNGFTNNIVLYLTTNSTGYLLQADAGINMSGAFAAQPTQ
ncbi:MAG: hypothetical protein LAO23_14130 [Acidobacteriia bacterium]|nr:hypothetical protein [Terriglobia bacterium]